MWLRTLGRRLAEAFTFAEVGAVLCERARTTLDAHQSAVTLFTHDTRFAAMADDVPDGFTDPQRLAWVEASTIDPQLKRVLTHHAPVDVTSDDRLDAWCRDRGYTGALPRPRLIPLVEPAGLLGTFRSGPLGPLTASLRRDLDVMGAYASARLVQLGVTTGGCAIAMSTLTAQQRKVGDLAATGLTNAEIASACGISINTIKKHLKTVFATLDVHTRAELATVLARRAPRDDVGTGVTRLADVWITKVP